MKIYLLIKQHKKIALLITVILDMYYFTFTNPNHMPEYLFLFGFILVLANIYIFCQIGYKLMKLFGLLRIRRKWLLEATSLFIFVLVIMQALGQLSVEDIIALTSLTLIGYWYATYFGSQKITN